MKTKKILLPLVALFVLGLSSCCDEKEGLTYSSTVLKNSELKTILTSKGFSFDKDGKLELNNLATSTVSLDLSNTKLKDLSGLDILPNLKEVKLSNNDYGPVFDFSTLPSQITSVDLTGNNIYDFEGLVETKTENDELKTTVLHPLKKLYLPASAKYNVEDLMPFNMLQGQETDVKMADSTGKLEKYTTVREIPDPIFCAYLKTLYPSMFIDKNHIDFSKMPKLTEQGQNIFLYLPEEQENPRSIEGVEYFINNPFLAKFMVMLNTGRSYKVGYLMPRKNIDVLALFSIEAEGEIDFSKATSLNVLGLSKCPSVKHLDLSHTKVCNQDIKDFHPMADNSLNLIHCPNVETITLANPAKGATNRVLLVDLPKLKKVDLSSITTLGNLDIFLDNTEVVYPKLNSFYDSNTKKVTKLTEGEETVSVTVSQKTLESSAFKEFIKEYGKYCSDGKAYAEAEYGAVAWKKK